MAATRYEAATLSRLRPAPKAWSPGPLDDRRYKKRCRPGGQARSLRRCNPQCRRRLSRAASGDGTRNFERLRRQCGCPLHSDGADRKAKAVGVCELWDAPGRPSAHGRSAVDRAGLERRVGLCREQAVRRIVGIRHRPSLERQSNRTRWSPVGWRRRWAALQRRTICIRAA